jgi:hypothetical protein
MLTMNTREFTHYLKLGFAGHAYETEEIHNQKKKMTKKKSVC